MMFDVNCTAEVSKYDRSSSHINHCYDYLSERMNELTSINISRLRARHCRLHGDCDSS